MSTRAGRRRPIATLLAVSALAGCAAAPLPPTVGPPTAHPRPSVAASRAPTADAGASHRTSPTTAPDGTPTPAPRAGWIRLADAPDAGAVWSPDSSHLLVWAATPGAPPASHSVAVMTRDGQVIERFDEVADPLWVDARTFLLYRLDWRQDEGGGWYAETGPDGERRATVLQGTLGSADLHEVDLPPGRALSNGSGVLAVTRFGSAGAGEYSIWADGALSDWRAGQPVSWSLDGARLLLVHSRDAGPAAEGWLEVVGPRGAPLWASEASVRVSSGAFDPTGAYLAYPEFRERPRQPRQVPTFDLTVRIADLATGEVSGFEAHENGSFAWTDAGQLVIVGFESMTATVYDRAGQVLNSAPVAGADVLASDDGSTLLIYDAELDEPPMQVFRGGTLSVIDSPGTMAGPAPALAPDGRGLVAVVRLPSSAPQGPPATVLVNNF